MKEGIVGTQELCPYLQAAACSSFSNHPVHETRRIGTPSAGQVRYDFASRAQAESNRARVKTFQNSQATFRSQFSGPEQ